MRRPACACPSRRGSTVTFFPVTVPRALARATRLFLSEARREGAFDAPLGGHFPGMPGANLRNGSLLRRRGQCGNFDEVWMAIGRPSYCDLLAKVALLRESSRETARRLRGCAHLPLALCDGNVPLSRADVLQPIPSHTNTSVAHPAPALLYRTTALPKWGCATIGKGVATTCRQPSTAGTPSREHTLGRRRATTCCTARQSWASAAPLSPACDARGGRRVQCAVSAQMPIACNQRLRGRTSAAMESECLSARGWLNDRVWGNSLLGHRISQSFVYLCA